MPRRETHRSLPETWKFFDPSDFQPNDEIVFHNPANNKWERGRLANTPPSPGVPIVDRDNRRIYIENTGGTPVGIELRIPPKKVDKVVLNKKIKISIEDKPGSHTLVNYQVRQDANHDPIWNVGPDGEIEVTLVPVTPAANRKEISNVNIDTLKNVQEIERVESLADTQIGALRTQIDTITNIRRKELLKKVTDLDAEIKKLVSQAGHFDEMGDLEGSEIEQVAAQIKELRRKVENDVRTIQSDLVKLQTELNAPGSGDLARKKVGGRVLENINKLQADMEKEWTNYDADQAVDRTHAAWAIKDAAWVIANAAFQARLAAHAANPRGNAPTFNQIRELEPPRAIGLTEPDPNNFSKDKFINAFRQFDFSFRNANTAAGLADPNLQPYRDMGAEIDRRLTERKIQDGVVGAYPAIDPNINRPAGAPRLPFYPYIEEDRVLGEIVLQVAKEWSEKEVVEVAKFDFKKEQDELDVKIKELITKADTLALKNTTLEATADALRADLNTLNGYTKSTPGVENLMANIWRDIGNREIILFQEESRTTGRSEKLKEIDVDLPPNVLREILAGRENQVADVMRQAYTNQIEGGAGMQAGIEEAMKRLFEPSPTQTGPRGAQGNLQANEAMIARLRQYGIKDWRHFKKLWDEKLAPEATKLIHSWAQDDIKNEIARNSSQLEKIRAIGGQMAVRVLLNIALVGGGVVGASALFASGGLAGLALVAAGGAVGGGVRAGLQKFVFGGNNLVGKWFADRQTAQLAELGRRERERAINNLLTNRFGNDHANNPVFAGDSLRMFTSMLAQAGREASAENVETDKYADEQKLSGDSRRIYMEAIKDIENAGDVPSEKQKMACAIAIKKLQERTVGSIAAAAPDNPMLVRILDGVMQGYTGNLARSDKYGYGGAAATVVLGAGVAVAFAADQTWARATMGGIGGALVGYNVVEGRRVRAEMQTARDTVEQLFDTSFQGLETILNARENNLNIPQADLDLLTNNVQRLNRLLHGNADTVADKHVAQVLINEKGLRKQVENLVYQTYRRGIFAQRAIGEIENHSRAATAENNITIGNQTNSWFRKTGTRALGIVGGAAVGATAAVLVGYGIKEIKELAGFGSHADTSSVEGEKGGAATKVAEAAVAGKVISGVAPTEPTPTSAPSATEVVHGGGSTAHPEVAPAHTEVAPSRPAGLIEAPTKVSGVPDWRHQIMAKLGIVELGHGSRGHSLDFHPGAKITLMDSHGNPVVDKHGHVVEYTFPKGGSPHEAMNKLQIGAKGLLKAGEIPTVKISGPVDVNKNLHIEHHAGGKTQIDNMPERASQKVSMYKPVKIFNEDYESKLKINMTDRARIKFDELQTHLSRQSNALDELKSHGGDRGEIQDTAKEMMRTMKDLKAFVGDGVATPKAIFDNDLLYKVTHATVGTKDSVPSRITATAGVTDSAPSRTSWTTGGEVANRSELAAMLKGTTPGGPAEAGTPQGGVKVNAVGDVAHPAVGGIEHVPTKFAGHEGQYNTLQNIKHDVASTIKDGALATDVSNDNSNVLSKLLGKIETALAKSPKLMDSGVVKDALDPSLNRTPDTRLLQLLTELDAKHILKLTPEERILAGEDFTKGDDFITVKNVNYNGRTVDALVAKESAGGSHAIAYKNPDSDTVELVTDPKSIFDENHLGTSPKNIVGGRGTARLK